MSRSHPRRFGSSLLAVLGARRRPPIGAPNPRRLFLELLEDRCTPAADHFVVSAPATVTSFNTYTLTVTAEDNTNTIDTGYSGTVHLTSTDSIAAFPTNDFTLVNGTLDVNFALKVAGTQTITATDTVDSSITGTSNDITVNPGATTHFGVSVPATAIAGGPFDVTVSAYDLAGNVTPAYTGTVHFTTSDVGSGTAVPSNYAFVSGDNGVHTFTSGVTLVTAGSQSVTATDTSDSTITGTGNVTVSAAAATHYTVSAPNTATAGSAFSFTVTAQDQFNNTDTNYGGTVDFTSTDGAAVLPSNSTLSNGTGTFAATLDTAGNQTITATDTVTSSITGTSNTVTVSPAVTTDFSLSVPATSTAGNAFSVTVRALDAFNNVTPGYTGTVHFTTSDSGSGTSVPVDYTFVSGDNGVHTFSNGVTLVTAGSQSVTATDTVTSSITGTGNVTVSAAAATHYTVSAPASATAGSAFNFTVTALDQFNNTATGYAGTVHFTSTDGQATLPTNSTLTNGVGTFSATLKTAGNQTLTATDTVTSSITGTSNSIAVSAAAATHFTVSAPGSATAGSAFSFTVTAQDQFNNTATGYSGTVHFTSTDAQAVLPSDSTLTNGTGTFSATLDTSGNQTITATDTVTSSTTGTSNSISVSAGATTHYSVSAPSTATAGSAFSVTVTAEDQFNNVAPTYTGTAHFTTTDNGSGTMVPGDYTFTAGDHGVHTFTNGATLITAGNQTITATDPNSSSITGTSGNITVSAAAATHFTVSAPSGITAGGLFGIMVTAEDQFNNTATGYSGTVHFTSTDAQAVLPSDSTLTNGKGTFTVTLETVGNQTITATDTVTSSITGTSNTIVVVAAPATHFAVSAPGSATAGSAFSVTVTAEDQFNNTATGYSGTVHFTTTDSGSGTSVPGDYTFVSGDNGVHTFSNGVTLVTAGSQTVTATDTVTSSITGTSNTITVSAAAATHYAVSAPSSATAGSAFSFTVTAEDQFNNTATGYAGTVHFTSTDAQAALPIDSTLSNGVGTFSATLDTAGNQTLTATDTVTSSITGTSNSIAVSAAAATHYAVSAPASATAGTAFSFTVTVLDQFNNTDTSYAGTVHFTSSDGAAVLPTDSTLTNGTGTFSATLDTAGNQTITATDTVTSSITGTSNTIAVSAAAATHFTVSAPASATAGSAFSFTVTALDALNNTATGYTGTVHFTSTDGRAVLSANATLTNGTGTFSATLKTAGNQKITATDTKAPSVTGTSGTIAVSAAAATHFTVSAPGSVTARDPFSFTVTVRDAFNNVATSFTGPILFSSSDGQALLPANGNLVNGTGTFTATLKSPGNQTLTATAVANSSITGTSGTITVILPRTVSAPLVVGAQPGEPGLVRVEGPAPGEVRVFAPYGDLFLGGVTVVAADVNGDGIADIVTGTATVSSHIMAFDGATGTVLQSFFAFAGFNGGVTVAAGDVNGDGVTDVLVAAGVPSYTHVKAFDGRTDALLASFLAPPAANNLVSIAAGDLNGDGLAEIIVGGGVTGPLVSVFQGGTFAPLVSFFPYPGAAGGTARVGVADVNGDGQLDLVTGAGPGLPPHVKAFRGTDLALLESFYAANPMSSGGVFVG
jgi:hypothetical protein